MGRLIDADETTREIMNIFSNDLKIALKSGAFDLESTLLKVKTCLDNQPTVFDEDKVVQLLEEYSYWTEPTFDEDGWCHDDGEKVVELYEAIDIVRKGGKHEGN